MCKSNAILSAVCRAVSLENHLPQSNRPIAVICSQLADSQFTGTICTQPRDLLLLAQNPDCFGEPKKRAVSNRSRVLLAAINCCCLNLHAADTLHHRHTLHHRQQLSITSSATYHITRELCVGSQGETANRQTRRQPRRPAREAVGIHSIAVRKQN